MPSLNTTQPTDHLVQIRYQLTLNVILRHLNACNDVLLTS